MEASRFLASMHDRNAGAPKLPRGQCRCVGYGVKMRAAARNGLGWIAQVKRIRQDGNFDGISPLKHEAIGAIHGL